MKMLKYFINSCRFIIVLFSLSGISFAQQHPLLGNFTTHVHEGDVILTWVILEGSSCNGIRIYRSSNNSEFEQIGEFYGICGSISQSEKYTFKDQNPIKNAHNHYKLELGIEGFSQVVSAEVIDIEAGNQVRPNPADERTRIYFDNNNSSEHTLLVFDAAGRKVLSLTGKQDFFDVELSSFQSGIYYFSISIQGNPISTSGKLVVKH